MAQRTRTELAAAERRIYSSVKEFNEAIRDFSDSLGSAYVEPFHRKIHLEAVNGVVTMTPVGKKETWAINKGRKPPLLPKGYVGGHARRNWQSSTSAPVDTELPGTDPSGRDAIADAGRTTLGIRAFTQSYISNPVPYIEQLEAGSSKLAPNGMVAVTVARLIPRREE